MKEKSQKCSIKQKLSKTEEIEQNTKENNENKIFL